MFSHRFGESTHHFGVLRRDLIGFRRIAGEVEEEWLLMRHRLGVAIGTLGDEMDFPIAQAGREEPLAAVEAEQPSVDRLALQQERG